MDIIFLESVKVKTHLGVPEWERQIAQTIILDIEISYDFKKACETDAIEHTIDYAVVVESIRARLTEKSFRLVEALAEDICQLILKEFDAKRVKLRVAKPNVLPDLAALGVQITREQ